MTPKRKIQRGLVWAVAGASAFGLGIGATSLVSAASSSTTDTATTADRAFTPHIPRLHGPALSAAPARGRARPTNSHSLTIRAVHR